MNDFAPRRGETVQLGEIFSKCADHPCRLGEGCAQTALKKL